MADTKLRLPLGVTGWTVYTRLKNESGNIWQTTTSTFVAYVVANVANYALATPETPASSGDYEATMPTGAAAGNYSWGHYRQIGGSAAISDPLVGSGAAYWDGSGFGTTPANVTDSFSALAIFGTITDPAPTDRSFVVTPDNGDPVPDQDDWKGLFFCLTSGGRKQAKRTITAYRKLTTTTALVTVGSPYAAAPANGDSWIIL